MAIFIFIIGQCWDPNFYIYTLTPSIFILLSGIWFFLLQQSNIDFFKLKPLSFYATHQWKLNKKKNLFWGWSRNRLHNYTERSNIKLSLRELTHFYIILFPFLFKCLFSVCFSFLFNCLFCIFRVWFVNYTIFQLLLTFSINLINVIYLES